MTGNDLISRSALLQEFETENVAHNSDLWHITGIKAFIENQPTAFNLDAVVEQLMVLHDEGYCPNEDGLECVLDKACSDCYREKVADIVRNGGKE